MLQIKLNFIFARETVCYCCICLCCCWWWWWWRTSCSSRHFAAFASSLRKLNHTIAGNDIVARFVDTQPYIKINMYIEER